MTGRSAIFILALILCLFACSKERPPAPTRHVELTVYAAASLRDCLQEIAPDLARAKGIDLVFNFGSSGDLAKQILAARKADVFFSADEKEMDRVAAAGALEDATRVSLLGNGLAVIEAIDPNAPASSHFTEPFDVAALGGPSIKHIALANVDSVPAGRYAKAWLESRGVWERIASRVLPGVDVRAALATVESGAAEAGVVYATDAARSKKVRVVFAVPSNEGPKIVYPVAAIRERPQVAAAKECIAYLTSGSARSVFERAGFRVLISAAADERR